MIFINVRVPSSWKNCITRAYKPPRPASVFTIIRREGDDIFYKYYDMMRVCFFSKYISLSLQQQRTPPCVCIYYIIVDELMMRFETRAIYFSIAIYVYIYIYMNTRIGGEPGEA